MSELKKLLTLFLVVCVFRQSSQLQEELLEYVRQRAKAILNEAANDDWKILDYRLNDGTCYTNLSMRCVVTAEVRAIDSPKSNRILDRLKEYSDTVPCDSNYDPYDKTKVQQQQLRGWSFIAVVMRDQDGAGPTGLRLSDALFEYYRNEQYLRAMVLLMNALESAANTFVSGFCQLFSRSLAIGTPIKSNRFEEIESVLGHITDMYQYNFISIHPISQLKLVLFKQNRRATEEERKKGNSTVNENENGNAHFELACKEFTLRYSNTVGYIRLDEFQNQRLNTADEHQVILNTTVQEVDQEELLGIEDEIDNSLQKIINAARHVFQNQRKILNEKE